MISKRTPTDFTSHPLDLSKVPNSGNLKSWKESEAWKYIRQCRQLTFEAYGNQDRTVVC